MSVASILIAGCNKPSAGQRASADGAAESSQLEEWESEPTEDEWVAMEPGDVDAQESVKPVTYRDQLRQGAIGADMLVVNGEMITVDDIVDPIRPELEHAAATMSPEEYGRHVQEMVAIQIWRQINERLVYRQALSRLGDSMNDVLDAEADRIIRARVNAQFDGRQSRFESYLADIGKSISEVREETRRRMLVADYLRKKFESQVPESTRPQLWRYYVSHSEEFTEPARTELFLIDIAYDAYMEKRGNRPGSADWLQSKEKARQEVDAALAELEAGSAFSDVATSHSKGIHAADGGSWGVIGSSGLVGRYSLVTEALASLDSNQHSPIIEGEDAFFIVGTGLVQRRSVQPFERAQERIKQILRQQGLEELEREYLEELRTSANVQRWREFQVEVIRAIPPPASLTRSR
jgi:hypothetical protein